MAKGGITKRIPDPCYSLWAESGLVLNRAGSPACFPYLASVICSQNRRVSLLSHNDYRGPKSREIIGHILEFEPGWGHSFKTGAQRGGDIQ
jgi:hypothetical protein